MTADTGLLQPATWPSTAAPRTPLARLRGIARAGNLLICVFLLGFGTWSVFAPLESAAIASGTVEAETSRKTIQHLEGGIIKEILVRDGDHVKAGQVLIRLDDTKARAELQALDAQFWDAKAREARLLAEQDDRETIALSPELDNARNTDPLTPVIIDGQQKIFDARREVMRSQAALIRDRIAQVEQEIVGLEAQENAAAERAEIIGQEMAAVIPMVQKGLERRARLLTLEREATEIEGRRGETAAEISRAHQVIGESQTTLLKLESDRQNEIAQSLQEARNQSFQLGERKRAVDDELERAEIRAPEDGIVTDLRVHTPGGVIGAGEALMDLVPVETRVIINASLRPEDIDVVHPGLDAEIHLLPYNQRRVAPLNGTVSYVSADRLLDKRTDQPYYAAKIRIEDQQPESRGIEVIPGMPVQVLIRTGRSTVALYAIQPLLDSFNRSFRED